MKNRLFALFALLFAQTALGGALSSLGTYCGTFPSECRRGTTSILTAKGVGANDLYMIEVDPTTGLFPVSAVASFTTEGNNGAAAPTRSIQIGGTDGTNLRAVKVETDGTQDVKVTSSVLPTGAATAAKQPALGTAGSASTDVISVQGIASMTALKTDGSAVTQPVSAASLPLPAGASTAAKQPALGTAGSASADVITVQGIASMTALKVDASATTQPVSGTVTTSNWPGTVDTNVGAAGASTPRVVGAGYPVTNAIVASNAYATTNVTTAAYVQLIASTANAINTLCISDSSGSIIKVATGAAASEVDRIYLPGGGSGCYRVNIAASTRISLKALDATASAGYFLLTGY